MADATYISTAEGTVYLATIQDVRSRRVVVHVVRQDVELMVRALHMAVQTRHPAQIIQHSDHGSQHAPRKFRQAYVATNVRLSMGSSGDCYDNAMVERLFTTFETKLIYRQFRQRFRTRAVASQEFLATWKGATAISNTICPSN